MGGSGVMEGAGLRRPQKSKTAQPTTKAGAVAGVEQRPEFSQKEQAGLHPESDVKRRGRKSKYRKEFARIAKAMCRQGATDYELAQEFEVATSTIWRWCSKCPEFAAPSRWKRPATTIGWSGVLHSVRSATATTR
jgi:hypothetical protein